MLRQLFLIPIMCSVYIWAGGHVDISPMAKMTRVWLSSESFNFVGRCASSFDDQLEWMTWNKRRCTMTRLDAAIEWMWPGNFARNQYAATCSQAESEGKELKQKNWNGSASRSSWFLFLFRLLAADKRWNRMNPPPLPSAGQTPGRSHYFLTLAALKLPLKKLVHLKVFQ